jgi:hypothetical protein
VGLAWQGYSALMVDDLVTEENKLGDQWKMFLAYTESRAQERKDAMKENDKYGGLLLNITTFILNDSEKYRSHQLSYRLSV